MRYDKFRGDSIQEILMQIRKKYGTNVYILETKEVKEGGILGTNFLSKKMYEIQVMVPEENPPYKPNKSNTYLQNIKKSEQYGDEVKSADIKANINIAKLKNEAKNYINQNVEELNHLNTNIKKEETRKNVELESDLSDIDNLIKSLQKLKNEKLGEFSSNSSLHSNKTLDLENKTEEEVSNDIKHPQQNKMDTIADTKISKNIRIEHPTQEEIHALLNYTAEPLEPKKSDHYLYNEEIENIDSYLMKIRENLVKSEFSDEFTHKFFQILKKKLPNKIQRNPKEFYEFIVNELKNFFVYEQDIEPHQETKVIYFVGPNGSGKTTSLAKVSAIYKLEKNYNISIISLDDYRLAATEQLKIYSNILNVPFYSPIKIDEFKEAIIRDNSDFVFVDTPGFSLRDEERLLKIKKFIDSTKDKEVHLVLSATMRYDIIEKFIDFFNVLNFKKIILTGLDEVKFSGFFIELADKIKKPYSFLMNGQNVPDDILRIEVEDLIKQLI